MEFKTALEYQNVEEILDLWKEIRKEILLNIEATPEDMFFVRTIENKWSVGELAEHLYLTQLNVVKMLKPVLRKKIGSDIGPQPELEYQKILEGLMRPSGVQNPPSVSPKQNFQKNEIMILLQETESNLSKNLEGLNKDELQKRGFEHPIFGNLNLLNWVWVMALHEYSHLISLKEKTKQFKN
ncbi:MAG: DinB family protein [Leptospiraceae bacterium]|nr:DinB family protein [Leptospiraceae bacterium]MCP5497510.1 DinB family protein [Leptospiraceae bacterium]